jgi:hypothetical protein
MKNYILFSFLIIMNVMSGQTRVQFSYDNEGNQVLRAICANCQDRVANDSIKSPKSITENDLIKDETYVGLSYYPNPVSEELFVKWINEKGQFVADVTVYTMTGQQLKQYKNLRGQETITVGFQTYPQGFYNLILSYNTGEKKVLKVMKK